MLHPSVAAAYGPSDLRCEYQENPQNISESHPRLSWTFNDPQAQRNSQQQAYQIQVASSLKNLEWGHADLWDTQQVLSSQNTLIPYQGQTLPPNLNRYHWRVRTWNQSDHESPWSMIAWWDQPTPSSSSSSFPTPQPPSILTPSITSLLNCRWLCSLPTNKTIQNQPFNDNATHHWLNTTWHSLQHPSTPSTGHALTALAELGLTTSDLRFLDQLTKALTDYLQLPPQQNLSPQNPLWTHEPSILESAAQVFQIQIARLTCDLATRLGLKKESTKHRQLAKRFTTQLQKDYITSTGRVVSQSLSIYAWFLWMDLFPPSLRDKAISRFLTTLNIPHPSPTPNPQPSTPTLPLAQPENPTPWDTLCLLYALTRINHTTHAIQILADRFPTLLSTLSDTQHQSQHQNDTPSFHHQSASWLLNRWIKQNLSGLSLQSTPSHLLAWQITPSFFSQNTCNQLQIHQPTLHGQIILALQQTPQELTLRIQVPPNVHITLELPTTDPQKVFESGNPATQPQPEWSLATQNNKLICQFSSGQYHWTIIPPH